MSSMPYREQVSLLLRVLPIVGREKVFALKGGTAINLFVRDLPRLSVDIDLTFLPLGQTRRSARRYPRRTSERRRGRQESNLRGHRQRLSPTRRAEARGQRTRRRD